MTRNFVVAVVFVDVISERQPRIKTYPRGVELKNKTAGKLFAKYF